MKIKFGKLKLLYEDNKKQINAAIQISLESGWYILGREVDAFERKFASYLNVKYVVGCSSGTDAIYLALKSLKISSGDEILTVANTCVPTISGIRLTGAIPRFIDINDFDYQMNCDLIERNITKKTKAIMPVNLYGGATNYDMLKAISRKYGIPVIEDNAQGVGSTYNNLQLGTIGKIGCFSFYPSKNLGAFGDAGAIATNEESLYKNALMLRNYGQKVRYKHSIEGINSRLDELQAAILKVLLDKLEVRNERRRSIAKKYSENIQNSKIILPKNNSKTISNFHLYVIRTKYRNNLIKYLTGNGIETFIHYPIPVHKQRAFYKFEFAEVSLPVTEKVSKEILSIPCYPEMNDDEVNYIIEKLNSF